jgi:hypothetical protein
MYITTRVYINLYIRPCIYCNYDDDFVIKSNYYSLTFLFDSYFGFQNANLRIMFCIFFECLACNVLQISPLTGFV